LNRLRPGSSSTRKSTSLGASASPRTTEVPSAVAPGDRRDASRRPLSPGKSWSAAYVGLTAPVPTAPAWVASASNCRPSTLQLPDRRVDTIQQHLASGKRLPRRRRGRLRRGRLGLRKHAAPRPPALGQILRILGRSSRRAIEPFMITVARPTLHSAACAGASAFSTRAAQNLYSGILP
jgi:hypothetical protein